MAIKLAPDYVDNYIMRARVYMAQEDYMRAVQDFDIAGKKDNARFADFSEEYQKCKDKYLEKNQSGNGGAELAKTNSENDLNGIKGFVQRHPIISGIITGLIVSVFLIALYWFFDDVLYEESAGIIIAILIEAGGIITLIVAGFVLQKLPLGFSISCLVSNIVVILIGIILRA
jgi:hypothetical protein